MKTLPQIFVYKRRRFLTQRRREELYSYLTPEEKNKIDKFKNRADAENFLIARVMQRKLIASLIDSKPERLIFGLNNYGRPFLRFPKIKGFDFNLSHSGDYVILAIADCSTGVDIEKIKPIDKESAVDYLTRQELNYLDGSRRKLGEFYRIWVLKESFSKAIGRGFNFPFKKIGFKLEGMKNTALRLKYQNKNWFFRDYEIDKNYKMVICSRKNRFPKEINFIKRTGINFKGEESLAGCHLL